MKKLVLTIVCAMIVVMTNAQKIHWLLFIDTNDPNVGQLDINGRELLKNEFVDPINAVLNDLGIREKIYDCYGDNCSPEKLKSVVSSLQCTNEDIVFFYYIGHGARAVTEDDDAHPWPQMCLSQHDQNKFVDLEVLHNQLKAKNPRLLITVGMCCNSYANIRNHRNELFSPPINYADSYSMSDEEKEMIQKMFTSQCGDLLATSAKPGQTSKGGQLGNYKPMDVFTTSLVANFDYLLEIQKLDLQNLFTATSGTVADLEFGDNGPQTPFFVPNLSNGTCEPVNPNPNPIVDPVNVDVTNLESIQQMLDAAVQNHREPSADVFAPNCIVRILGRNGKTQVDRLDASKYFSRISSSKLIMKVVPVRAIPQNGKIAELHVKEFLKERRY